MRKGTANREQVTANKEQKVAITNRYLAVTVSCWLLAVPLAVLHAAGEPDVFAQSGVGARPAGMGSAFVGLADDVETIFYNPAGLGTLKDSNLAGMLQSASLGTTRNMMAANVHWERGRFPMSVGFGWLRLHSGDIEVTSAGRAILGTEDFNQDLYVGSYGLEVIPTLSLGVNLKYFKHRSPIFQKEGLVSMPGCWAPILTGDGAWSGRI